MKTKLLIQIGIGVGGAAVGSLVTWLAVKGYYNKKAENEIAEARAFYSDLKIREFIKDPEPQEGSSEAVRAPRKAPVIDYTKFYTKAHTDDPAESESPPEGELDPEEMKELDRYLDGYKMTTDAQENVGIYLITEESYKNDFLQYDKQTLFYYTVDEILVTEEDQIIDNEEAVVGTTLDESGIRYGDVETSIFVRNADLGADFEIQKIIGSFR